MITFEDAKIGDRVWCPMYGWGTIHSMAIETGRFWVLFKNGIYLWWLTTGRLSEDAPQSLFWDEVKITPPEKLKEREDK